MNIQSHVRSSLTNLKGFIKGSGECRCNSHLHLGWRGGCKQESTKCGKWCYIDHDSDCHDAVKSNWGGVEYRWSCEACRLGNGEPGEVLL